MAEFLPSMHEDQAQFSVLSLPSTAAPQKSKTEEANAQTLLTAPYPYQVYYCVPDTSLKILHEILSI